MKLNPITALSALLSKLVVEHGSAIITEKNLAFLRDQLAATEKEIARLTTAIEKYKAEKQNFKTQFQNLKNENKRLTKKIQTYEKSTHDNLLDKEQILILQYLASLPRDNMLPLDPIMSDCNLSEQTALFHLQELEDESMIESDYINNTLHWSLDHDGRRYLIKYKLIP